MKKFLLTALYLTAIAIYGLIVFQIFPILWPIQPVNFTIIVAALISVSLNVIVQILELYIEESQ